MLAKDVYPMTEQYVLMSSKHNHTRLNEPTTPEEQIFDVSIESNTLPSESKVPELTPDFSGKKGTLPSLVLSRHRNISHSVPRRPVPNRESLFRSPVEPLKLPLVQVPEYQEKSELKDSLRPTELVLCGICEASVAVQAQPADSLNCGHIVHAKCLKGIADPHSKRNCCLCHSRAKFPPTIPLVLPKQVSDDEFSGRGSSVPETTIPPLQFVPKSPSTPVPPLNLPAPSYVRDTQHIEERLPESTPPHGSLPHVSLWSNTIKRRPQPLKLTNPLRSSINSSTSASTSRSNSSGSLQSVRSRIGLNTLRSALNKPRTSPTPPPSIKPEKQSSLFEGITPDKRHLAESVRTQSFSSSDSSLDAFEREFLGVRRFSFDEEVIDDRSAVSTTSADRLTTPLPEPPMGSRSPHTEDAQPLLPSLKPGMIHSLLASPNIAHTTTTTDVKHSGYPIKMFSSVESNAAKGTARVLLGFQCLPSEENPNDFKSDYQMTVEDFAFSLETQKFLQGYRFNNIKLSSVAMGLLRAHSVASLIAPIDNKVLCEDANFYLFERIFIILKDDQVLAAIESKSTLKRASVMSDCRLKLHFEGGLEIGLQMQSQAECLMWEHAVSNKTLNFPINPSNLQAFLAEANENLSKVSAPLGKTSHCMPAEIAICVPIAMLASNEHFDTELISIMRDMDPQAAVSVLAYAPWGEVIATCQLQSGQWDCWPAFMQSIDLNPEPKQLRAEASLDTVIHAAKDTLHNKERRLGSASVVLIASEHVGLRSTLALFPSDIAVSCICVGDAVSSDLSILAGKTGGIFSAARYSEVGATLRAITKCESEYVFLKMTAHIRPRLGTRVTNISQNSFDMHAKYSSVTSNQAWEIPLGAMRVGDFKWVIVDVMGELIPSQPLLQSSIMASKFKRGNDETVKLGGVRIVTPTFTSSLKTTPLLAFESNILSITNGLREFLDCSSRKKDHAFAVLHSMIAQASTTIRHSTELSPELQSLLKAVVDEMHNLSDSILNLEGDTVRDTLQLIWLLVKHRSMLMRSPLEAAFH